MRRSHKTKTLVLISNHVNSIYDDRWEKNVLYYTGMGQQGDQNLHSQNKTLFLSKTNKVNIHLFEVFKKKEYTYISKMFLDSEPYIEEQLDIDYKKRKVYIFPLKCDSEYYSPSKEDFDSIQQSRQKAIKKLSSEQLKKIISTLNPKGSQRQYFSKQYNRNAFLAEYAKRLAKGHCQLCLQKAPFITSDGDPYLETHHIDWLSRGGHDNLENIIALCPNCHKKMHFLNDKQDVSKLRKITETRSKSL